MNRQSISAWDLVNNTLSDAIACAGTAQEWARRHNISPQFVSDVRQGRREPSDRLARALGFRRIVSFEMINHE